MKLANPFKSPRILAVRSFINRHRIAAILILSSILIFVFSWAVMWPLAQVMPNPTAPHIVVKKPEPVVYYSPLTGKEVKDEATTKLPLTAVMIENSLEARPQSGLKQAGLVYEAIAEGGITRFLAIYQEDKPQLLGPVRSLRPYFVDWVAPYNASIVHVGGSSTALKEVRNGKYRDIDQFFNASTFWRSTDRYAPHNVYTSFERIDKINKEKGYTSSKFTSFDRIDDEEEVEANATNIQINFSSSSFNTRYTYNADKNHYQRHMAGAKHRDREKGDITPSVVIAMKVQQSVVMEDGYRESIATSGKGEAVIFQNGQAIKATWSKSSRESPVSFVDSSNKPIKLARGQTWIAAIPSGTGSVSW